MRSTESEKEVKKYAIAAAKAVSLIVPELAVSPGISQALDAGDQAERVLGHRYHVGAIIIAIRKMCGR